MSLIPDYQTPPPRRSVRGTLLLVLALCAVACATAAGTVGVQKYLAHRREEQLRQRLRQNLKTIGEALQQYQVGFDGPGPPTTRPVVPRPSSQPATAKTAE